MDHLAELKEFARLHGRGQGLTEQYVRSVLSRITGDEPGDPGSWARVWTAEGDRLRAGRPLDACRRYALARFPYHGDEDRLEAQRRCVDAFDTWRRTGRNGIERLEFEHPDGNLAAWASGLSADRPRPLLLIMGGIVSVKEQWAPTLPLFARLGFAAVATELPGVGENTLPYRADSWRLLPYLLDRLADRARVAETAALALSFSGHLALRAAAEDPRIRSIHTVGAPVAGFFTDSAWWPEVPGITVETLRRLTRTADRDELRDVLAGFPLTPAQLGSVDIPVDYVASSRDEIIPQGEHRRLALLAPRARFKVFDDVHGSPGHVGAMRRWLILSLLRARLSEGRRRPPAGAARAGTVGSR